MQNKAVKVFARFVSAALTLGVLYFAYVYGKKLLADAQFNSLDYWFLGLSFVAFLAFYAILSVHWLLVCRIVQQDVPRIQIGSFFASQPYKYLPTSLFTFSFRAKFSKQLGLSVRRSTYAQLMENLNIVGGGLIVGATFYLLDKGFLYAAAFVVFTVIVMVLLYNRKTAMGIPIIRKTLPVHSMIVPLLVACLAWVVAGISFILISHSLGLSPNTWIAIAANALGYALSILAVFAPGGIGVRELVLVSFGMHGNAIIMWRILTFIADLSVGFVAVLYLKFAVGRKP